MATNQDRGMWTHASNAAADALCPGRHVAQTKAHEAEIHEAKTDDAKFGDAVHQALCKGEPAGLDHKQADLYESVRKIEAEVVQRAFGNVDFTKAKPVRETRLWITFGDLKHSGQPDAVYRKGTRALIPDYKTLPGEQSASPKNMQLRDLAVLAWHNTTLLQEVWVCIIQPLVTHRPEITVYGRRDIEQSRLLLEARVKASNNPNAERIAGQLQCKFCKARAICSEYNKWAAIMLPAAPPSIVDVPMAQWTGANFATFLEHKATAKRWLEQGEKLAKERLAADPKAIPGFELVPGNVIEKIRDAQECFNRASALGVTLEEFMGAIAVYKTKIAPLVKAHTGAKGEELDAKMKKLLAGITESSQNAPSIEKAKV